MNSRQAGDLRRPLMAGLTALGIELPEKQALDRLDRYWRELVTWNRKMNLIARNTPAAVAAEKHFLDSLILLPLLAAAPGRPSLLDIGSGAGFPGLVLKAARRDLSACLVEARQRRVFFLRHVIRCLGLKDAEVVREHLTPGRPPAVLAGRRFQWVTSRAFSSLPVFLDLAADYCRPGGRVVCMKGPAGRDEVGEWRHTKSAERFRLLETQSRYLPVSGAERLLLVFKKR